MPKPDDGNPKAMLAHGLHDAQPEPLRPTQDAIQPTELAITGHRPPPKASGEPMDRPGKQFGPYQLLEKLGEGGMGAVFKARHTRLNKLVAIKVLPAHLTSDAAALARFDREMKAVGALEHPNIVRAMDADEHEGIHYLVMELVEGQDVQQLVKKHGSLTVTNSAKLLRQAAKALAYAHQHGLVHRDIKPSNLFLTRQGQLKILDLGLARLAHDEGETLTSTGISMGTPDYMAPEQWADARTADARCDLYALGCTLYFLLTGRAPYCDENHKSVVSKLTAHVHEPIPSLTTARSDVPANLDQLYQRLMAKSPDDRIGSAAELANLLEPICKSVRPSIEMSGVAGVESKKFADVTPTITIAPAVTPVANRKRRPRLLGISLVGGALAVVLGAAWMMLPKREEGNDISIGSDPSNQAVAAPEPPDTVNTAVPKGWHGWPSNAPPPAIAPFDYNQARQHQKEWAAYLKLPLECENKLGMKFRLIPPGEFLMGGSEEEIAAALNSIKGWDPYWHECVKTESPQRQQALRQPIYLSIYEVTQTEFAAVEGRNPSDYAKTGSDKGKRDLVASMETGSHPVENVSWHEAVGYCHRLSQRSEFRPFFLRDGQQVTITESTDYRLPTEVEWEFACRAGSPTKFSSGNSQEYLQHVGWFLNNSGKRTHKAGERWANGFELYDMHGNVWEWADDDWDRTPTEVPLDNTARATTVEPKRVIRGGGWGDASQLCRSASRCAAPQNNRAAHIGFRIAFTIRPIQEAK